LVGPYVAVIVTTRGALATAVPVVFANPVELGLSPASIDRAKMRVPQVMSN
jgi:hypothetical protein